jgi:uncharacterized membrane protein
MAGTENSRGIHSRTLMLTQLGVLIAIMLVLHFTGIGFITLGPVRMTIMWVPAIVGAITLGPIAGAVLGGVFGVTVLMDMGPLTAILIDTDPVLTVIFMVVIRGLLVGFLSGMLFKGFGFIDKKRTWSFEATGFLTALLNTTAFILGTVLIFGNHPGVHGWLEALWGLEILPVEFAAEGATRGSVFPALIALVGTQAFIEMAICTLLSATIARVLRTHLNKVS